MPGKVIRWELGKHYVCGWKRLYAGTGFPQPVQGKRGENHGESRHTVSILFFYDLHGVWWEQPVLVDSFGPQNVSCVPSPSGPNCCQMVQVRRTGLELEGSAVHLKAGPKFQAQARLDEAGIGN